MDIAAMSVVMNNSQLRMDSSIAIMNHTKQLTEQQGDQLVQMLEQSSAPHPTHGKSIDISV